MNTNIACLKILKDIKENRKLIFTLGKSDFKTKYAGQYLGIIWAFVQPVITVLVYWFVFEKALNQGTQSTKVGITVPYVLWLIAGLVPWFYFSELMGQGTSALIDYNYLVKKVVFKISTLPVVKMISSLFVHLFFVAFMIVLYMFYGHFPDVYTLQLIYYSLAMTILVMGLIYASSAIVVFFRDFGQLISIALQVGMWVTPIMWNLDGMLAAGRISKTLEIVLKLNPMYYIVNGYRDSLISKVWFWEQPELTLYFWVFTIVVFMLGTHIFEKLKVHFADVL
ncbi:MAG: ABC transporter permease [Lachnospiraceae bacterium]|nr:ABC transporter permease [Lachnospiraceae bacterium]